MKKTKNTVEGFWNTNPEFKKLTFDKKGTITVHLTDGRQIIVPLSKFPTIKKLTPKQHKTALTSGFFISSKAG